LLRRCLVAISAAEGFHLELGSIRFGAQIEAAATRHHLDPHLLAAVAAQESGGPGASSGNNIVGDHGHGHGLFQIDDRSWGFASDPAAMDPGANADFAASILEDNLQRYGGDVRAALSAYNSGSPTATGTTTTWGDGATLGYADSVLRHEAELDGSSTTLPGFSGSEPFGGSSLLGACPTDAATAFASLTPWRQLSGGGSQSGDGIYDPASDDAGDGVPEF
jgi:hypothetical protein